MNTDIETDKELRTMKIAYQLLQNVDKQTQVRVVNWLRSKLDIVTDGQNQLEASAGNISAVGPAVQTISRPIQARTKLAVTDREKVLAAAMALAESGVVQFTSRQISQKLKEVGILISNLTRTMTELVSTKPSMLIQLKKRGKTMQGRRLFMLSIHGRAQATGLALGY